MKLANCPEAGRKAVAEYYPDIWMADYGQARLGNHLLFMHTQSDNLSCSTNHKTREQENRDGYTPATPLDDNKTRKSQSSTSTTNDDHDHSNSIHNQSPDTPSPDTPLPDTLWPDTLSLDTPTVAHSAAHMHRRSQSCCNHAERCFHPSS